MGETALGDDVVDVDWNTDDELEIFGETGSSSLTVLPSHAVTTSSSLPVPPSLTITTYSTQAIADNGEASSSSGSAHFKLVSHFVGMGFSEKLVSKAIEENDDGNTESILNTLLTYSTLEDSPADKLFRTNSDPSSSDYHENLQNELSDFDSWSEDDIEDDSTYISEKHKMLLSLESTGSLSDKERKLLDLANMGYTLEEASIAMDRCGPEVSVSVLTDFMCAAQMAREDDCHLQDDLKIRVLSSGSSKTKKRKFHEMSRKKEMTEEVIRLPNPMIGFGVPSLQPENIHRSLPESERGPPYFYYENVALAPKGVWDTISRFLYDIDPEFVDSKYLCAAARKRGYIHNLPIEGRFPLIPIPPLTVNQAFPLSKRWWPSWDARDKMNCIQTAIASAKLTERIRSALERYDGEPPDTVKKEVLEQCRKWNLVWVGRNKAAPMEPDEIEMLLGFPKNHTRGGGISRTDRYKSLGNSFQVDTVAYHLSVLKEIYPNGINLLSLFSGIGGAEVALHRLGIKLKNVVSVEKSKVNRDIVRSWWEQTNQTGMLIDFDDVQQIDDEKLEQLADGIGGFDLIVGGSPCNNLAGSNRVSRDGLEGKESSLFFEYVRILNSVKEIMRARQQQHH